METSVLAKRELEIIGRLTIPPEAAPAVLSLKFSPEDENRMQELMHKNNRGTVTADEQAEIDAYLRLGNLLNILHARARLSLKGMV